MSTVEKFTKIYQDWADSQLLEAYQHKSDYGPYAVRAMELILKERNLWESIKAGDLEALIAKENEAASLAEKSWIEDRDERVFTENRLPPDNNGVYAEAVLLNKTRDRLGNKGEIKFYQENTTVKMSIDFGTLKIVENAPFKLNFFASKTVKRTNFFKTSEYYTLFVQVLINNSDWATLSEKQSSLKDLPKGWDLIDYNSEQLKTRYQFEYSNYEVRLTSLKKLLDQNRKF